MPAQPSCLIFGLLGMRLTFVQLHGFVRKPRERMFWWYTHLGNFIGSRIAAWSAVAGNHLIR